MYYADRFFNYKAATLLSIPIIAITIWFSMVVSAQPELMIKVAEENKKGMMLVSINQKMSDTILDHGLGWLPNDIIWKHIWDNNVNFQKGWRESYLRTILSLRESLSRQDRSTSPLNKDVEKGYGHLSINPESWIFPSYEGQMNDANDSLEVYKNDLGSGKAGFYTRADSLVRLIEQYTSLLGSVTNTLDITTFFDRDDRFYFAKGVTWGIYNNMVVISSEFEDVLADNGGNEITQSIINELSHAYFEPLVVLDNERGSMFNSHLIHQKAALLAARQKMNSLSSILLHKGAPSQG